MRTTVVNSQSSKYTALKGLFLTRAQIDQICQFYGHSRKELAEWVKLNEKNIRNERVERMNRYQNIENGDLLYLEENEGINNRLEFTGVMTSAERVLTQLMRLLMGQSKARDESIIKRENILKEIYELRIATQSINWVTINLFGILSAIEDAYKASEARQAFAKETMHRLITKQKLTLSIMEDTFSGLELPSLPYMPDGEIGCQLLASALYYRTLHDLNSILVLMNDSLFKNDLWNYELNLPEFIDLEGLDDQIMQDMNIEKRGNLQIESVFNQLKNELNSEMGIKENYKPLLYDIGRTSGSEIDEEDEIALESIC